MKVLFLDIDGVLNSDDNESVLSRLWKESNSVIKSKDRFGYLFDQRCVTWLEYIVMATGCKIVISSSWRRAGLEAMRTMWAERDLPGEVIDITPWGDDAQHDDYDNRGNQIQSWIDKHSLDAYCIVDDYDQMLQGQNFVETDSEFGLTRESALEIVKILNYEKANKKLVVKF
jgi:hypothetical protein